MVGIPLVNLERLNVERLRCTTCPALLAGPAALEQHGRRHAAQQHLQSPRVMRHFKSAVVAMDRVSIFKCGMCSRGFLDNNARHQHGMAVHGHTQLRNKENNKNGIVKPFKCEECGLRFAAASSLAAHSVMHRPFEHVCDCGVGYFRAADLAAHARLVHARDPPDPPAALRFAGNKLKRKFALSTRKHRTNAPNKTNRQTNKSKWKVRAKSGVKNKVHCAKSKGNEKGRTAKSSGKESGLLRIRRGAELACELCGAAFKYAADLWLHACASGARRACPQCPATFKNLHQLNIHRHYHKQSFKCQYCNKVSNSKSSLAIHERTHTGEKPLECMFCDKAFADPSAFLRHKRIHLGIKPYRCERCPLAFSDKSALIGHSRARHTRAARACPRCGKRLASQYSLNSHVQKFHSDLHIYYECDYCGKRLARKTDIKTHIQKYHDDRNECPICPKIYCSSGDLKAHAISKHPTSVFLCDICPTITKRKRSLAKHMKTHEEKTRVKQWKFCPICDRSLSEQSLKEHIARHYNKRAERECKICYKQFLSSVALRHHGAVEHGARAAHWCDECGARRWSRAALRRHVLRAHLQPRYCACGRCFVSEALYRRHRARCAPLACPWCGRRAAGAALRAHMARHAAPAPALRTLRRQLQEQA